MCAALAVASLPQGGTGYGAKSQVNEVTDFAVILGCNRKVIIDF